MSELPFSPNFTARVFAEARRRRLLRRAGAAVTAVLLLGGGGVALGMLRSAPPAEQPAAELDLSAFAYTDDMQLDPVDYMFPEATPLAELAYSSPNLASASATMALSASSASSPSAQTSTSVP
jgi:hypothetical protein